MLRTGSARNLLLSPNGPTAKRPAIVLNQDPEIGSRCPSPESARGAGPVPGSQAPHSFPARALNPSSSLSWHKWQAAWAAAAVLGLALGALLRALGAGAAGDLAWGATNAWVLVPTAVAAARSLLRKETGVDVIAVLAMAGALAMQEWLAGAIIAVMLTGGMALETYATARARRELTALLKRAPRIAHRRMGTDIVDIAVAEAAIGDVLIVKPGEVVPSDGILVSAAAVLDESAITGEARPREIGRGTPLQSGATNAGQLFELRATALAAESTYAGIVRLVNAAEHSKAPVVRLANRYAAQFLLLAVLVAGAAWLVSGDAVRALAVLVVATPCPLILAAPAAIIAGVSRAARHGIIIKGGAPLEILARAHVLLFDKTGTLTAGRPSVVGVESFGSLSVETVLRLAACLEQLSSHPFAPAILAAAQERGLAPSFPAQAREQLGSGISGQVEGRQVALGRLGWVAPQIEPGPAVKAVHSRTAIEGSSAVYLAVDGKLEGALILQDSIRTEAPRAIRALRKAGVSRIHMVTGDHPDIAEVVGDAVGIDTVYSECTPEEKVEVVRQVRGEGATIMVGDGVNDAPALAQADVGVAMGARGATAASEAAGVVLTADRLEGLVLAVRLAQRSRRIALQSIWAGMGLSLAAMVAAAAGLLPPVAGAVLQEAIDVAVILNALRALAGGGLAPVPEPAVAKLGEDLEAAHRTLRPVVEEIASLAMQLDALPPQQALAQLKRVRDFLIEELLPHEREEQQTAYPVIAQMMKGEDPTGPLTHTHHEIARLSRLYGRMVDQLAPQGPGPDELRNLRRALYGLHAVLKLHFAQEEELYVMFGLHWGPAKA